MRKFKKITAGALAREARIFNFLDGARIRQVSKKGDGVFIKGKMSPREREYFWNFGIVLDGGALIIPSKDPETFLSELDRLIWKERERRKKEAQLAEIERKMAPFRGLPEEFPILGLEIKISSEGDDVFFEDRDGGTFGIFKETPESLREVFEKEAAVRNFRNAHWSGIVHLDDEVSRITGYHEFWPLNWKGSEVSLYCAKERKFSGIHSLRIHESGIEVEWTGEGMRTLREELQKVTAKAKAKNHSAWDLLDGDSQLTTVSRERRKVSLGEEIFEFPSEKEAERFFKKALEKGAFLPRHWRVGEGWRETAKTEDWNERRCLISEAVLAGEMLRSEEVMEYYHNKDKNRTYGGKRTDFYIGDLHLRNQAEIDVTKVFAREVGRKIIDRSVAQAEAEKRARTGVQARVTIRVKQSRTRGEEIFCQTGELATVLGEAIAKVKIALNPRRGFLVSVVAPGELDNYGFLRRKEFSRNGAIERLESFRKDFSSLVKDERVREELEAIKKEEITRATRKLK